jgi:Tfp pilus assembly protein PilF
MRVPLQRSAARILVLAGGVSLAALYTGSALIEFLAAHFADTPTLASLRRAVRLAPGNAEYAYRMGRYYSLVETSPSQAEQSFREAVRLNPHQARYWFALAETYQLLDDTTAQRGALEHALAAEPTTPEVAWEAANFYVVQGDINAALKNLRVVMANDPYLPSSALELSWRIQPDIDLLLRDVVPATVPANVTFLEYLVSRGQTAAASKVWDRLASMNQPVDRRYVFDYVRYLVAKEEPEQARRVWQQAAALSDLGSYQPSSQNLVVNGDFDQVILNAGFDWMYRDSPDVSLTLDPTQFNSGRVSLHLEIDSRGLEDAGIRQVVAVNPDTAYQFSGYFKAENLAGAGGLHFFIQDLYTAKVLFMGEDFSDTSFWKEVNGSFRTNPDTRMIVLRIQREPASSPIKGRLWIDNIRLYPVQAGSGGD